MKKNLYWSILLLTVIPFFSSCKGEEKGDCTAVQVCETDRAVLPITGTWLNLAYKDVRNKYTNPVDYDNNDPVLWETKVKELSEMGMEYLVLMEVANDGKSYYPSKIMDPQYDPKKKSPVEAILDEAAKHDMKVFLSTGWAQNQDDNLRIPAIKERQLQIMDEIGGLYKDKKAFYGWYLPVEDCINPIFPKHAVDAVNALVERAHKLTPGKKTLISPYGLGLSDFSHPEYEKTLAQLKVDIIAYQDEVGCVREATPLPELRRNWQQLRAVHDKIGIEMWANCETFTWERGTNDRTSALIPAAYQRLLAQQVAASVGGVDKIVSFMFYGIIENPASPFQMGQPGGSSKAYEDYMAWRAGDTYWKLSEAAHAGRLCQVGRPDMVSGNKALMDEVLAEEDDADERWIRLGKGCHEEVIDLRSVKEVNQVMVRFLNFHQRGIGLTGKVYLYVSEDGETWQLTAVKNPPTGANNRHDVWADAVLFEGLDIKADFLKVAMDSEEEIYLDEIFLNPEVR